MLRTGGIIPPFVHAWSMFTEDGQEEKMNADSPGWLGASLCSLPAAGREERALAGLPWITLPAPRTSATHLNRVYANWHPDRSAQTALNLFGSTPLREGVASPTPEDIVAALLNCTVLQGNLILPHQTPTQ